MKNINDLIKEYAELYGEPLENVKNTVDGLGEGAENLLIESIKKKENGIPEGGENPLMTSVPISGDMELNQAQIEAMNIPQPEGGSLELGGSENPASSESELTETVSSGLENYRPNIDLNFQSQNFGITPSQSMEGSMNTITQNYADYLKSANEQIKNRLDSSYLNPETGNQDMSMSVYRGIDDIKKNIEVYKNESRDKFLNELSKKKNPAKKEEQNITAVSPYTESNNTPNQYTSKEEPLDPRLPYQYGQIFLLSPKADNENNLKKFKDWEEKGYGVIQYSNTDTPSGKTKPPAFIFNKYGVNEMNKQSPEYREIIMEKNRAYARERLSEAYREKEKPTELQEIIREGYKNTGYILSIDDMMASDSVDDLHKIYAQKFAEKETAKNPNADFQTLYQDYYRKNALPSKSEQEYIKIGQSVLEDYERGFEVDKYYTENAGMDNPNVTTKGAVFEEDKKELAFIQSLKNNPEVLKEVGRFFDEEGKFYIGDDRFSRLLQFKTIKGRAEFRNMVTAFANKGNRIQKELDYEKLTQLKFQIDREKDGNKRNQLIEKFNRVVASDERTEVSMKQLGDFNDVWENTQTRYLKQRKWNQEIEAGYQNGEALPSVLAIGGNIYNGIANSLKSTIGGMLRIGNLPFGNETFSKIISDATKPTEIGGIQSAGIFDGYNDYKLGDRDIRERGGYFYEIKEGKEKPVYLNSAEKRKLDFVGTDREFSWKGMIGSTTEMATDMFLAEVTGGAFFKGVNALSKIKTLKNAVAVFGEGSALTRSLRTFNRIVENPSNHGVAGWFVQTFDDNIKEGLAHGMNNSQAVTYGAVQSMFTGILSKINPDAKFFNTTKTFQEKLAYNLLHGNKKNTVSLIRSYGDDLIRAYGKEVVGEEIQELTELAVEHLVKTIYNGTLEENNRFDRLSIDEITDTIVQTAITVGALQIGHRIVNGAESKYAEYNGDIYNFSKISEGEKISMLALLDDGKLFPHLKNDFLISGSTIDRLEQKVNTAKKYIDKIPDKEKHSLSALSKSAATLQKIERLRNSLNTVDEVFKPEIDNKIISLQEELKETLRNDLERDNEKQNAEKSNVANTEDSITNSNTESGLEKNTPENIEQEPSRQGEVINENTDKEQVTKKEKEEFASKNKIDNVNTNNIIDNETQNENTASKGFSQENINTELTNESGKFKDNAQESRVPSVQNEEINETDLDNIINTLSNIQPVNTKADKNTITADNTQKQPADNEYEHKGRVYTQRPNKGFYFQNKTGRPQKVTSINLISELSQLADQRLEDNTEEKGEKDGFVYRRLNNGAEYITAPNGKRINPVNSKGKRNANFEKRKAIILETATENELKKQERRQKKEAIAFFEGDVNPYIQALLYFAQGGRVSAESINKEVLGNSKEKKRNSDIKYYTWAYLGKKNPPSIERASEIIWGKSIGRGEVDQREVRDALIDVLQTYGSRRAIAEDLTNQYQKATNPYYGYTEKDIRELEAIDTENRGNEYNTSTYLNNNEENTPYGLYPEEMNVAEGEDDFPFQRGKGQGAEFRKINPREFWNFVNKLQKFSKGVFKDAKVFTSWNKFINYYNELKGKENRVNHHIGNKARMSYEEQIRKKNPNISEEHLKESLDFLHSLEDNKENTKAVKVAVKWLSTDAIRLPFAMDNVKEAISLAEKNKIDPMQFKSPMDIINKYYVDVEYGKPVNPDTIKVFTNKRTVGEGENQVTIYDIEESEEGQKAVTKICHQHFGYSKRQNNSKQPWCLAGFTRKGEPTESAKNFWFDRYNSVDKKIAFQDGKPIAFMAHDQEYDGDLWWNLYDSPSNNLPLPNGHYLDPDGSISDKKGGDLDDDLEEYYEEYYEEAVDRVSDELGYKEFADMVSYFVFREEYDNLPSGFEESVFEREEELFRDEIEYYINNGNVDEELQERIDEYKEENGFEEDEELSSGELQNIKDDLEDHIFDNYYDYEGLEDLKWEMNRQAHEEQIENLYHDKEDRAEVLISYTRTEDGWEYADDIRNEQERLYTEDKGGYTDFQFSIRGNTDTPQSLYEKYKALDEPILTGETKEDEDLGTLKKQLVPVFETHWHYAENTEPDIETFDSLQDALNDAFEEGDMSENDYSTPYKDVKVFFNEEWVDSDGDVVEEGDEHIDFERVEDELPADTIPIIEYGLLHTETFESNEEKREKIEDKHFYDIDKVADSVAERFEGMPDFEFKRRGWAGNSRYMTFTNEDREKILVRIANHNFNPKNIIEHNFSEEETAPDKILSLVIQNEIEYSTVKRFDRADRSILNDYDIEVEQYIFNAEDVEEMGGLEGFTGYIIDGIETFSYRGYFPLGAGMNYFHNGNGTVYGAKLPDGSVYFNPKNLNYNTAVHEFSHVWEQILPKSWAKGLEHFKQTSAGKKIYNELKEKGHYKHLSDNEIWSEAMNTYIGNYGEWRTLNPKKDSPMTRFKEWLMNMFKKLGEVFGIRNMTPDEHLGDFVNKVYSDLTSGREIDPQRVIEEGLSDQQLIGMLKNMGLVEPAVCP